MSWDNTPNFDSLPENHSSDRDFFYKWCTKDCSFLDISLDFEHFMLLYFPEIAPTLFVAKKSGKPFKDGKKIAMVSHIVKGYPSTAPNVNTEIGLDKKAYYAFVGIPNGDVQIRTCCKATETCRKATEEEIKEYCLNSISETIGLLTSMIRSGENFTSQSNAMHNKALKCLKYLSEKNNP